MRCRIVGQQNADVDPNIEDFDERMPHGLFVPDAEVKCLAEQSQLAMAANTQPYAYHRLRQGYLRRRRRERQAGVASSGGGRNHQIT
jgi:hypothetical protein